MFRIDNASAVTSRPAPLAAGTPGYFGRGDPATGLKPTVLSADWANMMQEELMAIVAAAGVSPSKTDLGQVWASLQKLLATRSEVVQSLTTNGYYKAPAAAQGGAQSIFQWGTGSLSGTGARTATQSFNIPFPTACFQTFAVDVGTGCYAYGSSPTSLTAMTIYVPAAQVGSSTTPAATVAASWRWWAIGC